MKILVAIKQVPDPDARLVLDESRTGIVETDLQWEVNESDRYALETALRIKEGQGSGEVVVCSVGPERARKAITSGLAMGCDRGIHLVAPEYQGGDPLAIARALVAVAKKEEADLVLTGTRSDDFGWAETPLLVAGLLDWPAVFLTIGVELQDGTLKVTRELEGGRKEVSEIPRPAVLAIQSGIYPVRYTSLKGIMAAKRKPVDQPTPAELGLSGDVIGQPGSRLKILEMAPPEKKGQCEFIEGDPAEAAKKLIEKLRLEAKVL